MIQFLYKFRYIIRVGNLIIDMQEFFSKYFISRIDTGPSMLLNGSNSIIFHVAYSFYTYSYCFHTKQQQHSKRNTCF